METADPVAAGRCHSSIGHRSRSEIVHNFPNFPIIRADDNDVGVGVDVAR